MADSIVSKIDEISSRVEELENNLNEITQKNELSDEVLKLQAKVKQAQQHSTEGPHQAKQENSQQQAQSSNDAKEE